MHCGWDGRKIGKGSMDHCCLGFGAGVGGFAGARFHGGV